MPKPTPIDRLAKQAQDEMHAQVPRLAEALKGEFAGPDAQNVGVEQGDQIIRDNWANPQWRASEGQRIGNVKLVQQAMAAHGLDPSLLRQHVAALKADSTGVASDQLQAESQG